MKGQTFKKLINKASRQLSYYSPDILTGVGIAGVAITAYLSAKAAVEVVRVTDNQRTDKKEKTKLIIKSFSPAVVSGIVTASSLYFANDINRKQQASIMSAYLLTNNLLKEYKDSATNDILKTVSKKNYSDEDIIEPEIPSTGDKILFYEEYSGRYFWSTRDQMDLAEMRLNEKFCMDGQVNLNDFYKLLGLNTTDAGSVMGWSDSDVMRYGVNPIEFEYIPVWELPGKDVAINREVLMIIYPWPPICAYEDI